jgi:hypothetical protein
VYPIEWFLGSPERDLANLLDDASDLETWLRLQVGELPILWADGKQQYNADFVVIEATDDRWAIEVKADNQNLVQVRLNARLAEIEPEPTAPLFNVAARRLLRHNTFMTGGHRALSNLRLTGTPHKLRWSFISMLV